MGFWVARQCPVVNKLSFKSSFHFALIAPGPWYNIKMPSYQYRKSHWGDKTVIISSYLQNGISDNGKIVFLYWIGAQFTIHYVMRLWRVRCSYLYSILLACMLIPGYIFLNVRWYDINTITLCLSWPSSMSGEISTRVLWCFAWLLSQKQE